jgi:heat shock protein HslJ
MLIFVQQEEVEGNPADLIGTVWQLVWMDGQAPIEDSSLTLAFHDRQLASGYAGCRDYVATYEAQGGDLAFAYLGMLGPVCSEQALLEQEGNYTTVLGWTAHYQLTGDRLTLRTIRGEILTFEPVPARVQPDVEGPTWSLLSFVQPNPYEESPVPGPFPSDVLSGTQITAVFAGGTLSGSAGCNGYSTAYRRDGTSLSLEAIATTKKACLEPPGLMDQEQRYLDFLQGVTTAHVYDHELWLETGDGRALVLVARREGVPALLRITNGNPFPLDRVVVILPDERIDFGSLASGETSDYQEARYGVYAYAAFEVAFDGQTIEQPVVDWVGEYPLPGESFTYVLSIDPKRPFMLQIQNQVRQE